MSARVRINTSAGAPESNLSRMAPTAPNVPSMAQPVSAWNCDASAPTSPCAAPPLRMRSRMADP
jgi:hypothetical protein